MPELPFVENLRRMLLKRAVGHTVKLVRTVRRASLIVFTLTIYSPRVYECVGEQVYATSFPLRPLLTPLSPNFFFLL